MTAELADLCITHPHTACSPRGPLASLSRPRATHAPRKTQHPVVYPEGPSSRGGLGHRTRVQHHSSKRIPVEWKNHGGHPRGRQVGLSSAGYMGSPTLSRSSQTCLGPEQEGTGSSPVTDTSPPSVPQEEPTQGGAGLRTSRHVVDTSRGYTGGPALAAPPAHHPPRPQ